MPKALSIGIGVAVGVIAGGALSLLAFSEKAFYAAILGLVLTVVLLTTKYRESLCIFAMLVAAPLAGRVKLIEFDPLHNGGAIGYYILPADVPLIFLYLIWIFGPPRETRARSNAYALLFLPFLLAGAISIFYSENPLWAGGQWVIFLKAFIILLYAAKRLSAEQIPFCLAGLACALSIQGAIGILQTITRSNLYLDRLGIFGKASALVFRQTLGVGDAVRGMGLTGHPNLFASYTILLTPLFFMLTLADRHPRRRLLWWAALALGTGGVGVSLTRSAYAAFAAVILIGFVLAVIARMVTIHTAVVVTFLAALACAVIGFSFSSVIMKRLKFDWSESMDFRMDMNRIALRMADDHPIGGVGLNNFTLHLPQYGPWRARQMLADDQILTVVHNLYLLILSEMGALGLLAFLLFWIGISVRAALALPHLDNLRRAGIIGILLGCLAMLAADLGGFQYWIELNMYTSSFMVGILAPLTVIRHQEEATAA